MPMANPERGEVDLVTPTKTYTLFLSTNALCAMEKRMGKSYGQILNAILGLDMTALRAMTYAVLQTHHAREFPDEMAVGKLIDTAKMKPVKEAMVELFTLNTPPDESKNGSGTANPPEAGADGIGDNSTSTVEGSG
jgi:hypothetical protein